MLSCLLFFFVVIAVPYQKFCVADLVITPQQFIDWNCSSICGSSENKFEFEDQVKELCVELGKRYLYQDHHSMIRHHSGCKDYVSVKLNHGFGSHVVGLCSVSSSLSKCITKGQGDNDVIIYNYLDGKCYPEEFSTRSSLGKSQGFSFRRALRSFVNAICCGCMNP